MKPALIIGSLVLLTAVILSQNACNNEMAAMSSSLPDPVLIQTQGPKNFDVKLESQSSVSLNLADERKFKVKATAQTAFAGSFKITLDRAGLATLDPSNLSLIHI